MKVLLATSLITYMPGNYRKFFEVLLAEVPQLISGLVLLDNFDLKVAKSIVGLPHLGAHRLFLELTRNIARLPLRERQQLFKQQGKSTYLFKSMNDQEVRELVREQEIDLIVNVRTRDIYRQEILTAPTHGCLNIHHGLLPHYRGTMCDLYALCEGREAGFSIHQMTAKVDAGDIFHVETVSRPGEKNYVSYLARTAQVEALALARLLRLFAANLTQTGTLPPGTPNTSTQKKYTKNPTKALVKAMKERGMIL